MPFIKLILGLLVLLAAVAGVYLTVDDVAVDELLSGPIYMYGGEHTGADVSPEAITAIDTAVTNKRVRVHLVVQFKRLVTPAEEALLEAGHGIDVLEYIPERAYVVSFPAERAEDILEDLEQAVPARRGVVAIQAADKLSPRLGDPGHLHFPPHTTVVQTVAEFGLMPHVSSPPPGVVNLAFLNVHFFADIPRTEQIDILQAHKVNGEILGETGAGQDDQWQVMLPVDYVAPLLAVDSVRWVEPVARPPVDDMHEARAVAGYDAQPVLAMNATQGNVFAGQGVTVAQWEKCAPRDNHPGLMTGGAFGLPMTPRPFKRVKVVYTRTGYCEQVCGENPCDYHATMVAGIYMGNGRGKPCATNRGEPGVEMANGECRSDDFQGMAAQTDARAYALPPWIHPANNTHFTIADLTIFKSMYKDAIINGATIAQNSWGESCDIYANPGGPFGASYVQGGFYLSNSVHFDTVTSGRDCFGSPSGHAGRMLVVASAGNYGDERSIPSLWGSVRVANSAKNVLSVGNVNTQSLDRQNNWAHLSSGRGPTADGRIAPVLSAPGIKFSHPDSPYIDSPILAQRLAQVAGKEPESHGLRTTYPKHGEKPHTFKAAWGTSFSAPVVSGAAALLTETYRNTCTAEPSPEELRAILIHTALDMQEAHSIFTDVAHSLELSGRHEYNQACELDPAFNAGYSGYAVQPGPVYAGPDYVYGYGMVQADRAREYAAQSHFISGEITRGWVEYKVHVSPDQLENGKLRVTLAWDDPPWAVNAPQALSHGLLLNDLDLELIDPSGKRHLPWVLDPENPAEPARQNTHGWGPVTAAMRDQRNTVEQVEIEHPQTGEWTIRVRAGQMVRPPQAFSLVSGVIAPASACAGLPATSVEYPLELPDIWLLWWLFWLALLILVLLIIELLRLIFTTGTSLKEWLYAIVALLLLAAIAALLYIGSMLGLAALVLILLILAAWRHMQPPP